VFVVLRRFALSLPSLIVVGLVLAYLLFAWLAFEPLLKWAAPKFVADHSGHTLSIERARFDPFRLTLDVAGLKLSEPSGKPLLAFAALTVDFEASSLFKRAYTFKEVRLVEPKVEIELRHGGGLNWLAFVHAFASKSEPEDAALDKEGLTRLLVRHAVVERGRVGFEDNRGGGGFKTAAEPLDIELHDLSTLPDDKGSHAVSMRTTFGAQLKWKGVLGLNPLIATGDVALDDLQLARVWPYLRSALNMAPPEGKVAMSLSYQLGYEGNKLDVHLSKIDVRAQALAAKGLSDSEPALVVEQLALTGGHVDLLQRVVKLDALSIEGGRVAITRSADGRINLQDWASRAPGAPPAEAARPAASASAPAAAQPWHVTVGRVSLDRVSGRVIDQTFQAPLAVEVGKLRLRLKADARLDPSTPQVLVDDLGIELGDIRLMSQASKTPLLELGRVQLDGGRVDLAARQAALARLDVTGGKTTLTRDANGALALLKALALRPAQTSAAPAAAGMVVAGKPPAPLPARTKSKTTPAKDRAAKKADPASGDAPWRYRVDEIVADGLQVAVREESIQPVASVTLQGIRAEVRGFSDDANAALPVRLQFQVHEGGRFEAQGTVVPAAPSADIRLKLSALSLKPAQPYIAHETNLVLVGGQVGTAGRARYQQGKFRYDGEVAIHDLLLNEAESSERFLAWKSLATKRLIATPERLDIDEVQVNGLGAKILIFKDRTINLAKIVKAKGAAADKGLPATAPAAPVAKATNAKPYQMRLGRVRVSDGEVDFADLSLALPFGARIHHLQGNLVGLSNEPGATAQLEFEGQVDEYGLSRAAGQINLFDPTAFTDIRVVFQNVEMTTLTPYSATFAGRRIASGKLSLNLEYKVKARQLQGENQVVMDQLTLGERVESPTAMSLPLDLALAILQDSDGKIDLGLPVSGSLDDPQFSYGSIIWKAIVNVITKVVTAPFRALGALFGGGDEQTARVDFDAGEAALLPPEREKLVSLAQALAKRPRLALHVQAAYNPRVDRAAIQDQRVRRAVATQMGQRLAADEAVGPISTADPKARTALEQLYKTRFGARAFEELQAQFAQANPKPPPTDAAGRLLSRVGSLFEAKRAPLSAQEAAQLKGANLHALLVQRLLEAEPVGDDQLLALGTSRAQAIQRELAARGVATERIQIDRPTAVSGVKPDVAATLSLGAMPRAAAASQAQAQ
jgi:hypothetical protein